MTPWPTTTTTSLFALYIVAHHLISTTTAQCVPTYSQSVCVDQYAVRFPIAKCVFCPPCGCFESCPSVCMAATTPRVTPPPFTTPPPTTPPVTAPITTTTTMTTTMTTTTSTTSTTTSTTRRPDLPTTSTGPRPMSTPMPSATIDNNPFTTAPPTTTLQSTSTASAPVVTDASGVNQASLFTHSMTANNRNTDGETDDDGGVDSIAVIIGAVAAALICVMCVVLALALAYRKRVKDQQINAAIASQTNTSAHFETFPVAMPMGAGPHVNNTVYQPSAFSTQAFDSAAAVAGAFQCPMCTNCYPTDNDVLIHVQRRHPNSSYVSATTGDFSTASFRPQVTYDSELPRDDAKYRAYDIPTQPSHLYVIAPPTQSERGSDSGTMSMSHEPSNYRGLQPYSTMGEERFAKFQQ